MAKSLLERLSALRSAEPKKQKTAEKEAAARWPNLVQLLTEGLFPDGSERERSKVTLLWEDGVWKAGVTEPGLEMSAWATSRTLEGLLDALEARLASEDPDVWRRWAASFRGRQGSKKRG